MQTRPILASEFSMENPLLKPYFCHSTCKSPDSLLNDRSGHGRFWMGTFSELLASFNSSAFAHHTKACYTKMAWLRYGDTFFRRPDFLTLRTSHECLPLETGHKFHNWAITQAMFLTCRNRISSFGLYYLCKETWTMKTFCPHLPLPRDIRCESVSSL